MPNRVAWPLLTPGRSPRSIGRYPLGHLRAAVLRGDDQLRRSAGHRHPQADAAEGIRLERDRLRRHRLRVPARLRDRVSVRRPDDRLARHQEGFTVALVVWSLAAMAHAEAPVFGADRGVGARPRSGCTYSASVAGFIFARLAARVRRGGQFPGRDQGDAEWFPKKERALATGIFNSGTNIGALVTPLVVPWITLNWGWYWAFIITGALGFLWLFFWIPLYRSPDDHPRVGAAELAHIRSDPPDPQVQIPWLQLLQLPADLGVRARQVPDRPGVVALPVLDSRLPQPELRHRSEDDRPAAHGDLSHRRRRRDRRRLAVVGAASSAAGA